MAGISAEHPSFFERVMLELKKLFTHVPGWEASAAATMTYVAPMVEAVVALTDPAAAPAVTALIAKVQSATAAAAVLIKASGPKPTLLTYLNAIQKDLALVESVAGVTDAGTKQKLGALIETITAEVNAVVTELQTL